MRLLTLLFMPGATLVVGVIAFAVVTAVSRNRAVTIRSQTAPSALSMLERRRAYLVKLTRFGAAVILLAFAAIESIPYLDLFARYFVPAAVPMFGEPTDVRWWMFAAPIAGAAVVVGFALLHIARDGSSARLPVVSLERRGLLTFVRRRDGVLILVSLALLALTCLATGVTSSIDNAGQYATMSIPDSLGGGSATFFGWTYGVPTLISTFILATMLVVNLHIDAVRPFVSPGSVEGERVARMETARVLLRLVTAAVMLTLGGVWLFVGAVGGSIESSESELFVPLIYAIAPILRWAGLAMQVISVAVLLAAMRAAGSPREYSEAAGAQAVRVSV